MKKTLIRVWNEMEAEEVKQQLLLVGELSGNCENCQHLGIDFVNERKCPACGTEFRYIGFRKKGSEAEELSAIRRLKEKRPDLIVVDYTDIRRACGKSKAHDLFNS